MIPSGLLTAVARNEQEALPVDDLSQLREVFRQSGIAGDLLDERPHLFSAFRVFVERSDLAFMARLISAIDSVVALPAWQTQTLARAPAIAQHENPAAGVFFGYDFHLSPAGPRLIEINTNAGGALLNALRLTARPDGGQSAETVSNSVFLEMFRQEWRLVRGDRPLSCVAIVDEAPQSQYLYPEFLLFQSLFSAAGIAALIADPRDLQWENGGLFCRGQRIDLVYNRLTDFALAAPQHAALRAAYLDNAVVLTPHPRVHALFADKRNLVKLSDPDWLVRAGVDPALCTILREGVPRTQAVTPENAMELWRHRRAYFFKPATGYGSKGAYRGDKMTRGVFDQVSQGGFVAQELVTPPERLVRINGVEQKFKFDLRLFVYGGQVQLVVARLYQGQTTNFRTPGGGFARVTQVP